MEEKKAKASSWSKIKKSKRMPLYIGGLFLVVLVVLFLAVFLTNKSNEQSAERGDVVFSIEGKNYYKNEMLELGKYLSEVNGSTEDDVLTQVYDIKKEIAALEKLDINPSEDDILDAKNRLVTEEIKQLEGYAEKYEFWFDELAKFEAGKKYVGGEFAPTHKGYVYVFNYSESDKQSAEQKANDYRQKLEAGDIDAEEVLAQIKSDAQLNSPSAESIMYGRDVFLNWDEEVKAQPIKDYISSLSSVGLSQIIDNPESSYFYFLQADEVPGSSKIVSIDEYDSTLKGLSTSHNGFRLSTDINGEESKDTGAQTNE